jgi:glycosyltransferase involved in cell wall biosynthesis
MHEAPRLSVIMPVHRETGLLAGVRSSVHAASAPPELVIVLNDRSLEGSIKAERPNERVVLCERRGRGFALARGVGEVTGEVVVLLHSDTLLPPGWDIAINRALADRRYVGGGFHIAFDRPSRYLNFLLLYSDLMVLLGRAMWGDRAVFVRARAIRKCLGALDAPLFEDVRLSKCLRRMGKLVLLKERVVTSADHFWHNGPYTQTARIIKARLWYAFGGDPQRIYDYYYSR